MIWNDSFAYSLGSQVLEEPYLSKLGFANSVTSCSPFCSDVSDFGVRGSVGVSDSAANSMLDCERENQGPQSRACSSPNAFPGNFSDSFSPGESDEVFRTERTQVSKHEIPAYSVETSFPEAQSNNISICGDNLNLSMWIGENESQFKHVREDVESERMWNLH